MGFSSCTGPMWKKELQTVMLGEEVEWCGGASWLQYLHSDVKVVPPIETLSLWRIQTLSLSTVFIGYSWDWLITSNKWGGGENVLIHRLEGCSMLYNSFLHNATMRRWCVLRITTCRQYLQTYILTHSSCSCTGKISYTQYTAKMQLNPTVNCSSR